MHKKNTMKKTNKIKLPIDLEDEEEDCYLEEELPCLEYSNIQPSRVKSWEKILSVDIPNRV